MGTGKSWPECPTENMIVRPGTAADLPNLRSLMNSSRSYLSGGREDLPDLLNRAVTVVGEDEARRLWGFVAFQIEVRPGSLPPSAPDRVPLRAAALAPGFFSNRSLSSLLDTALVTLRSLARPLQIYAITNHPWLNSPLEEVGFQQVDQIRFYLRTQRSLPSVPSPATLRPIQEQDLGPLAQLDSETFDPLWHMGRADLIQLCFTARIQVAEHEGKLVGYTATTVNIPVPPSYQQAEAQIVRLAVHPSMQRRGIGHQLLVDSIRYAHEQSAYRVQLNTQESNKASQRLYESYQFRRQGQNVPVLSRREGTGEQPTKDNA
jgi:ribosomal protein S18 acetylase RimI-like enzyme